MCKDIDKVIVSINPDKIADYLNGLSDKSTQDLCNKICAALTILDSRGYEISQVSTACSKVTQTLVTIATAHD